MIEDNIAFGWKQHFPTYNFKERDIAIEEYKTAAKNLEVEERVFLNASNIAVVVAAGLGSLAVGSLEKLTKQFEKVVPEPLTLTVLIILMMGFEVVALRYFADRQKSVVFAARKVIVLRRMLGLNYGTIQLVLPNWRIEGADEPFAVRLFPGWNTYVTYPYFALSGITSAVLFFLLAALMTRMESRLFYGGIPAWSIILLFTVAWAVILAYVYRKALLDTHERTSLLVACNVARAIHLKLVKNIEYVIYRATLARYEFIRLRVDLTNLKNLLVFIEDRQFYSHHGVSPRALVRAFLGLMRVKRRSGGSTITQQLVRTLFIEQPAKRIRRKLVEILLALWFDRVFTKNDQLELYLAAVRFERGVFGVFEAMHHFWGHMVSCPSKAESFFLIERVSNIQSLLLQDKIIQIVRAARDAGLMTIKDLKELCEIYQNAIEKGKIKDPNGGITRMIVAFDNFQKGD